MLSPEILPTLYTHAPIMRRVTRQTKTTRRCCCDDWRYIAIHSKPLLAGSGSMSLDRWARLTRTLAGRKRFRAMSLNPHWPTCKHCGLPGQRCHPPPSAKPSVASTDLPSGTGHRSKRVIACLRQSSVPAERFHSMQPRLLILAGWVRSPRPA